MSKFKTEDGWLWWATFCTGFNPRNTTMRSMYFRAQSKQLALDHGYKLAHDLKLRLLDVKRFDAEMPDDQLGVLR